MTDFEGLYIIPAWSVEQIHVGGELSADLVWEFIKLLIDTGIIKSDDADFVSYVLHGRGGTLSFNAETNSFKFNDLAKWLVKHRLPYDYYFAVPLDTWQMYRPEVGHPVNVQVNSAGRPILEWHWVEDAIGKAAGDFDALVQLLRLQFGRGISPLPPFRVVGKIPPMPENVSIP